MTLLGMFFVAVVFLQISVLVTTVYLHRDLTHGGLELNVVVKNLMHLWITLFIGIVPREWVAVHRKHHRFSDREGDPHSPYIYGLWHVFFGNFFYYRREKKNRAMVETFVPEYKNDLIDRLPLVQYGILGGLAIFVLMFGWAWGAGLFVFHAVAYVLLNAGVNSFCHWVGYRNFQNMATNFRLWAYLTWGEGLHNNHHQSPRSARFSARPDEFDPAWPVIRLLEKLGLARVKNESLARI